MRDDCFGKFLTLCHSVFLSAKWVHESYLHCRGGQLSRSQEARSVDAWVPLPSCSPAQGLAVDSCPGYYTFFLYLFFSLNLSVDRFLSLYLKKKKSVTKQIQKLLTVNRKFWLVLRPDEFSVWPDENCSRFSAPCPSTTDASPALRVTGRLFHSLFLSWFRDHRRELDLTMKTMDTSPKACIRRRRPRSPVSTWRIQPRTTRPRCPSTPPGC